MRSSPLARLRLIAPGGGPAWSPTDYAALEGWWAGDVGTYQDVARTIPADTDTDPVAAWADLSGNNRHFIDGAYTDAPTLAAAYKGGKNCIRFSSSSMLGVNYTRAYPCTVYMALWMPDSTYGTTRLFFNSRVDPNQSSIQQRSTLKVIDIRNPATISLTNTALGAWMVLTAVFNTTNSLIQRDNGTPATGDTGTATQAGIVLNGSPYNYLYGPALTIGLDMVVGEILVYGAAHDADQRTTVYDYLNARWA